MAYDNLNPFGPRKRWDVEQEVDFPPINLGQQIGPMLGAELFSLPGLMGSPSEAAFPPYSTLRQPSATADVSGVSEGSAPQATETEPTTVSRPKMTLPWNVTIPGQMGEPSTSVNVPLPITERGNQQFTMTVPSEFGGGSAEWTKAMPEATAKWLEEKRNEQNAQREAGMRLAENQARNQALAERVRANEERFKQIEQTNVLRDLHYRDPKAAAELYQRQQLADTQAKQRMEAAELAGTPESQAFRRIAESQGLASALVWLKDFQASKATTGRQFMTPEVIEAREAAKVRANYGPTAQGLKGATSQAQGQGGAIGKNIGQMEPLPGAPGVPGVTTIARAQQQGKPLPASERSELSSLGNIMGIVDELMANWDENQQFVGVLRGPAGRAAEKFGGVLLPPNSPAEARFRAATQDINNRMIYFLTGKQINEQEARRLDLVMPNINQPPVNYYARLERFQENMQKLLDARIDLQTATGDQIRQIIEGRLRTPQGAAASKAPASSGGWGIKRRGQ